MKAISYPYFLQFKRPSGTSRGVLTEKETWFIEVLKDDLKVIGECALLRSLSYDDTVDYAQKINWVCRNIHLGKAFLLEQLVHYPSICFGVEQVFVKLDNQSDNLLFDSDFYRGNTGISINGLVWMGSIDFMQEQIREKIAQGFGCIKIKIGALDFESEYSLLKKLRREYAPEHIEIRVDANGGFSTQDALEKLKRLSDLQLHSIEQPIAVGQWSQMAYLCEHSPLPIALDEELIGVFDWSEKKRLLEEISPKYIILKPSLIGGYTNCEQWISLAKERNIGWWVTSALESNIGLSAIAQWTATLNNPMPQGLGTGGLYTNNIDLPLQVKEAKLWHQMQK